MKKKLAFGLLISMVPVGAVATGKKISERRKDQQKYDLGVERIIDHWYRRSLRAAIRAYIKTGNHHNEAYRYFNEALATIFDMRLDRQEWVKNMIWMINRDFERREPRILVREDWVQRKIFLTKNYLDHEGED